MASKFVVKKVTDLKDSKVGDELPTSDFSIYLEDDKFIQYEFLEDSEEDSSIEITPGIFSFVMKNGNMDLTKSSFNDDNVLDEYIVTADISSKIDSFFGKIPVYKEYGLFPKRGMLLYGAPGVGKSQTISKVCKEYTNRGDTAVILWSTSDFDPRDVKSLIKNLKYAGVEKLILVAEDIGGAEYVGGKMAVKASLLSLLDNIEKTFTIPTIILATTNYPENLIEALTNRPQRFDDVIKVLPPSGEFRVKFVEFFMKKPMNDPALELKIKDKKYDLLSVAHLKEVVIRSAIYDITLSESLDQIYAQSKRAKSNFEDTKKLGFGMEDF